MAIITSVSQYENKVYCLNGLAETSVAYRPIRYEKAILLVEADAQ